MQPNDADELVGLMPDDVDAVEVGGARFLLGPVPADVWARHETERTVEFQDAHRRAIAACVSRGEEPTAQHVGPDGVETGSTNVLTEMMRDAHLTARNAALCLDLLAYSLRGHERLVDRRRQPVHFGREGDRIDARTAAIYRVNHSIVAELYPAARRLNMLEDSGKKP